MLIEQSGQFNFIEVKEKAMDYYEIIIKGHLNKKRFIMFEQVEVLLLAEGNTRIAGYLDQSALHAVLNYIRDLGLKLISVKKAKNTNN